MDVTSRNLLPLLFLLSVLSFSCAPGVPPIGFGGGNEGGSGGAGGSDLPCGVDCATIKTPECTHAECNTGQLVGPLNTCIVVELPDGTECDDGKFCTTADKCAAGACTGGEPFDCGIQGSPCDAVVCYEESKSCDVTPVNDGTDCTPEDLCEVNGVCQLGQCIGEPKDCSFSPLSECNQVGCDPGTGKCVGVPDPAKNDLPCVLTGDLCAVNKVCNAGICGGGSPKDCSGLDAGCQLGMCDAATGVCSPTKAPVGTQCTQGLHQCDVGMCDVKGDCIASAAPNGTLCNDHNSCTKEDLCTAGDCSGGTVAGCSLYLFEGFETCPSDWTLGGDWECGKPDLVGPPEAHTGDNCIATQIMALYHVNQSFSTAVADSPLIDLTDATSPVVSFWAWDHTEGGTYDGWNLQVSTNNGTTFSTVPLVTPPYNLTIAAQPAWGGNHSAEGWKLHSADLGAYIGQPIILRFGFRSDGATVFPGVYIDDVTVSEPEQSPLYIVTTSPLADVYSEQGYSVQIEKEGGTASPTWSIVPGGMNDAWLTIDAATGVLSGTPTSANVGPVTVIVRVEEPTLPSNYDERPFTFNVNKAVYYTSFEGACPDGWALAGDWECGVPANVGPATAYVGAQCLATKIAGAYSNIQTYTNTTATSPDIDLTGIINPKLTFRMWVDTEGGSYDGFHLEVSNDGGTTYEIVTTVLPVYPLTVGGKPAWGGHQQAQGWQAVTADLAAYAGQIIRVRYAFQTDSSGVYPGVYIDDVLVN